MVVMVIGFALFLPNDEDYDYLRIHIKANSNSQIDQNVKYKIKDCFVQYLTLQICEVKTKQQAIDVVNKEKSNLEEIGTGLLLANGLTYGISVKISNEYFPTRQYSNTTLESGYYDAIIVELGQAVGDNWWCVVYPPLCFGGGENTSQINFKSRFVEWFKNIFD